MKHPITVLKFGGTSVTDIKAMQRCVDIIASDANRKLVVLSAPSGITNLLVALTETGADKMVRIDELDVLLDKRFGALNVDVQDLLSMLKAQAGFLDFATNKQAADAVLSLGEQFSTRYFMALLEANNISATPVSATQLIKTNNHFGKAVPDMDATTLAIQATLAPLLQNQLVVTQGFIGSTVHGDTLTTLGRGGSDYSAALLAEAIGASTLEIWTDVPGVLSTDPRLCPKAYPLPEMSFDEAAELSTFGAKVLHPATLWPAIRSNTAIFVGSSLMPDVGGTMIAKTLKDTQPVLRAVALRQNQTLLTVHSLDMFHAEGFLASVFAVLAKHHIGVDSVTTSEVRVALTLDNTHQSVLTDGVLEELKTIEHIQVEVETGLSLVALIGNNMHQTSGLGSKIFGVLDQFNIRLICHGASSHNICFLVHEKEGKSVVKTLHKEFFE